MHRLLIAIAVSLLTVSLVPLPAGAAPDKTKRTGAEPAQPTGEKLEKPPEVLGFTDPTTGMEFVLIKGGCYRMGDVSGHGDSDEKPVHEVCVSDFAIGKYEVTNAQYRKYAPGYSSGNYQGNDLNGDNQPVVNVSYKDEVAAYIRWLNEKSDKRYRLPTEAEWEYAARAGTTTRNYWGSGLGNPCAFANVFDMTSKRTFRSATVDNQKCNDDFRVSSPVGSFKPNAFGLYDMMGNVWEWVSDWYEKYGNGKQQDPQGPASGWARVTRGGSWYDATRHVRASKRSYIEPGFRLYNLGFRLAAPAR